MGESRVWDIESGQQITAGELLRKLSERSGIGRNEWHEKVQSQVSRSLGAPSKLSDVFANRRQLPLRDIVLFVDVLPLPKKTKEHYICELLRVYIDPSLRKYISDARSTRVLRKLREENERLEQDLVLIVSDSLAGKSLPIADDAHVNLLPQIKSAERFDMQEIDDDNSRRMHFYICRMIGDVVRELSNNKNVSPDTQQLISYLVGDDFIERIRVFGKWFIGDDELGYSWIRGLPQVPNAKIIEQALLLMWSESNKASFDITIAAIGSAEASQMTDSQKRTFYLDLERATLKPYVRDLFDTFRKECPSLWHFFEKISPSFRYLSRRRWKLKDIVDSYHSFVRAIGSENEAVAQIKSEQNRLSSTYKKRLLDNYFRFVFSLDENRGNTLFELDQANSAGSTSLQQRFKLRARGLSEFDDYLVVATELLREGVGKLNTMEATLERDVLGEFPDEYPQEFKDYLDQLGFDKASHRERIMNRLQSE